MDLPAWHLKVLRSCVWRLPQINNPPFGPSSSRALSLSVGLPGEPACRGLSFLLCPLSAAAAAAATLSQNTDILCETSLFCVYLFAERVINCCIFWGAAVCNVFCTVAAHGLYHATCYFVCVCVKL